MPYSAPPNFTTGQIVTEANLDTLSDDITFLAGPPRTRVYNNANISHATSGTLQAVTFNSERYDTDTMHSTAVNTSRITFTTAGTYDVFGALDFDANATGYRQIAIRVGGATYIASVTVPTIGAGAPHQLVIATTYAFTAGQYVELMANQTSGAALNILASANYSPEFGATLRAVA